MLDCMFELRKTLNLLVKGQACVGASDTGRFLQRAVVTGVLFGGGVLFVVVSFLVLVAEQQLLVVADCCRCGRDAGRGHRQRNVKGIPPRRRCQACGTNQWCRCLCAKLLAPRRRLLQ